MALHPAPPPGVYPIQDAQLSEQHVLSPRLWDQCRIPHGWMIVLAGPPLMPWGNLPELAVVLWSRSNAWVV